MANSTNNPRFRVGGSTYTAFQWNNSVIALAKGVRHTAPQPVAPATPIQPMDQPYPLEIITPGAIGPGTLQISKFEFYNTKVWDDLLASVDKNLNTVRTYNDLREVFVHIAATPNPITCVKIVNPPTLAGQAPKIYGDLYKNCVIADIRDDEEIEIGTMEIVKNITVMYTQMVRLNNSTGINIQGLPKTSI